MKRLFINLMYANKTVKLFFERGHEFCPMYTGLLIGFCYTNKYGESQEAFPRDRKSFAAIKDSITDF